MSLEHPVALNDDGGPPTPFDYAYFTTAPLVAESHSWTGIDKRGWPRGPWDLEPDAMMWCAKAPPHYRCLIRRLCSGVWAGYVALPPGHPVHGKRFGTEWAAAADGGYWVIGFDFGHGRDYWPGDPLVVRLVGPYSEPSPEAPWALRYRGIAEAMARAEELAADLARRAGGDP